MKNSVVRVGSCIALAVIGTAMTYRARSIGQRWKQRLVGEVSGQEVLFPAQSSVEEKNRQSYKGKSDWWHPMSFAHPPRRSIRPCG